MIARRNRALSVTRLALSMGGILLMSVQCGVPLGSEPLHRFDTCEDLETYLHDQVLYPRVETRTSGAAFVLGCAGEPLASYESDDALRAGADEGGMAAPEAMGE